MSDNINRSVLLNSNKFEKLIIYPILVFSVLAAIMVYLCLEYNIRVSIYPKEPTILSISAVQFRGAVPYMLIGIALMLICIISWSYYISKKIVGPHDRIVRELDEILQGKKTDVLTVRKNDKMFSELLERINKLIEKL